jgi:hypothetical protein
MKICEIIYIWILWVLDNKGMQRIIFQKNSTSQFDPTTK